LWKGLNKKEETPQLNEVLKNTETPQYFAEMPHKKRGNTSTE